MGACRTQFVAALAGLALLTSPAHAQVPDPYARELAQGLAQTEITLSQDGYVRAAGPFADGIARGQTRGITLSLRAGQDYLIVGVCDARCGGLGLSLNDPTGTRIASGGPRDGASAMRVRVRYTAAYTVDVAAPRCTSAPCWYAVNVYTR